MSVIVNGTSYIPALNGSLVNINDCTIQICSLEWGELDYVPSLPGNLAYLIIFIIVLLAQLGLGFVYRTWGFLAGLSCGLLLEIVGYVGRLLLHQDIFEFNYFIIYLVCLTIAPAFLSASIYLSLSRLVIAYDPKIARFSPKTYTLVFVCCDILSLVLQAVGGALAAVGDAGSSEQHTGVNIMIAGLAFQVASLTLFMTLSVDFVFAVHRARSDTLIRKSTILTSRYMFRIFPWAIALATVTIFIRCCFRVAELKDGFGGSLANNQTLFMIFEGPMIIIAVFALTVCHPGICFGGAKEWQAANWTWKAPKSDDGLNIQNQMPKLV